LLSCAIELLTLGIMAEDTFSLRTVAGGGAGMGGLLGGGEVVGGRGRGKGEGGSVA